MRLWKLDSQSLWLDELHTMNEADPDLKISDMLFYLKCCDQHPPLYFFMARLSFILFGHTAVAVRLISAVAGTVSIWAMYMLGKEILNRKLGLIAAALTTVNYYNLFYSQEARGYILAFLFSVLSFVFFIRLLKRAGIKSSILYALFSLLLIYSHYYGLFVLISQAVLVILFFFFIQKSERKRYILYFLLSGAIVVTGYLPWIPHLKAMSAIQSFWVQPVSANFLYDYFLEYFGNTSWLKYPLFALLLFFFWKVFASDKKIVGYPVQSNPLWAAFIILFVWIIFTNLIPYIRSILVVPMLYPRYTIVILPAFLIILAYAIYLINHKSIRVVVLMSFIALSIFSILQVKKYYSSVSKSQFREMTRFVVENNKANYPIIDEVVSWQHQYYFKAFKFKPVMLPGKKQTVIDSILNGRDQQYKLDGFWIVGAHGDQPLTHEQKKVLETSYVMVKDKRLFDAWAELYIAKSKTNLGSFIEVSNLPSITQSIRYNIESMNIDSTAVSLNGWAFIDGTEDNKEDSIFVSLTSPDRSYMAAVSSPSRDDVAQAFNKPNLTNSGLTMLATTNNVIPGTYQLGITIKNAKGKFVFQSLGREVNIRKAEFMIPTKINKLPNEGEIIYDLILEENDNSYTAGGWAAIKNQDADKSVINLILRNDQHTFLIPTDPYPRPDVTASFKNEFKLDNSGYATKFIKAALPPGKYQVGFLIRNERNSTEIVHFTEKYIDQSQKQP